MGHSPTGDGRIPKGFVLSREQSEQWVAFTYWARACEIVLKRFRDPKPRSLLDLVDRQYSDEKVSTWTKAYLRAAAEHLGLWSDYVAPFVVPPGAVARIRPRPYLLLARGALESTSYALWLLKAASADQCVERFVHLMRSDFEFHRKALLVGGRDTSRIDSRIAALEVRCAEMSIPLPSKRSPSFANLIGQAATTIDEDANYWVYLWNAASGAGHGQNWFGVEGYSLLTKEEYEPGHYRISSLPDPGFVTDTIEAAVTALRHGTQTWLMMGGHDPESVRQAIAEVAEHMPKKQSATKPTVTEDAQPEAAGRQMQKRSRRSRDCQIRDFASATWRALRRL